MPWLKTGDNAATHPIVMRVLAENPSDDRAINEVFGFVMRCALQSAGHTTDYIVDVGTAYMLGGARTDELMKLAERAGYWRRVRHNGHPALEIVQDPEFIHMRLKSEINWERQRKADAANPAVTVPVRLRDGDACRYCARIVQWNARKGALAGTYDHREPGKPATVDTYVVACRGCNSGRRDAENADAQYPLRPAPERPYYSEKTAEWLHEHGHQVTPTEGLRPGIRPDPALRDVSARDTPLPGQTQITDLQKSADTAETEGEKPGRVGTGSKPGPGSDRNGAGSRRRRGNRGGRPRPKPTTPR